MTSPAPPRAGTTGSGPAVVAASPAHVPHLAANLRIADCREIMASHGHGPATALCHGLARSTLVWTVLLRQEPIMMFGAAPDASQSGRVGVVWMLGTDGIAEAGRAIARQARHYIALMHGQYPCLHNYVHARNRAAIAFLRFCGFTVAGKAEPCGRGSELFYHFWRFHV
jgi:Acetyltransferases